MIMSTIFSPPATAQVMPRQAPGSHLGTVLKGWWMACLTRRIEQAAIVQLHSMSDRELADIGLTRSQIGRAVRGEPGDRPFRPHC